MYRQLVYLVILLVSARVYGQQALTIIDSGRNTSLRGLSIPDDNAVWVTGNNGYVGRSVNGAKSFEWLQVPGYERQDFRDVEAFDSNTALIMAVAEPALILKTSDGGKSWKRVFEDTATGMFLDAMDFAEDRQHGIVIGDPMQQHVFLAVTEDGGDHWKALDPSATAEAVDSEAFFAASGTNVRLIWDPAVEMADLLYVSGGKRSRLFINNEPFDIPIIQGKSTTGANSIVVPDSTGAIIVGGDFSNDTLRTNNCVLVKFDYTTKEVTFETPPEPPHGYRSCVALAGKRLISCGTSGVDLSDDGGQHWQLITRQSFHVARAARDGKKIILAGPRGTIALLLF